MAAAASAALAPSPDDVHALAREVCQDLQGILMLTAGLLNECPVPVRITLTKAPRAEGEDRGRDNPVMLQVNSDDKAENAEVLLALQYRSLQSIKQARKLGSTTELEKWRREHAEAEREAARLAARANAREATGGRGRGRGRRGARAAGPAAATTTPAVEELDG